jgi:SAM-dependent methyltransferase
MKTKTRKRRSLPDQRTAAAKPEDMSNTATIDSPRACGGSAATGCSASLPPVLDPCCGPRMWWFEKADERALFGDRRSETLTVTDRSHGNSDGTRVLRIEPDVKLDFRALPYQDESFHLVAFDPPHLVRAGAKSWMAAKYGKLGHGWREDLRAGFEECFRVLRPHGVLVFKWNETQVKLREVLSLTPLRPLFGNTSGKKAGTHWIVFMKPNADLIASAREKEKP